MTQALSLFCSHLFHTGGSFLEQLTAPLFCTNEVTFITQSILVSMFAIAAIRLGRGALTAFIAVCWVLGNLFVIKEATIFGLEVVTSDGFAIGANIGVTLIHQYYGEKAAKNSILVGIYSVIFFLLMSKIHLLYTPNIHDTTHPAFLELLGRMTRVISASLFVSYLSQNLNLYLFDRLSRWIGDAFFGIASFLSLTISQIIDTLLFTVFALYGDVYSIIHIVIFSSIIKCIAITIAVPAVTLCRTFITKPDDL